jgi:hypothetical protein
MLKLKHLNSGWELLSKGTSAIGRLVGAAALIKFALSSLAVPVSKWLAAALAAYTTLFHPLVDYSAGLIVSLLGYKLLPWAKDLVVLYALIGAAFTRGILNFQRFMMTVRPELTLDWFFIIVGGIAWPSILMMFGFYVPYVGPSQLRLFGVMLKDFPEIIRLIQPRVKLMSRQCAKELLVVFAIAGAAIFLNAAGQL